MTDPVPASRKKEGSALTGVKETLRLRAEALTREALQTNSSPPEDQVVSLERLARVYRILDSVKRPNYRTPTLAFTITAALLGLLLVRLPSTEVDLRLQASQVGLVSAVEQRLTPSIPLRFLGTPNVREVNLPRSRGRKEFAISSQEGATLALRLSASQDPNSSLDLEPILVQGGTSVSLGIEVPGEYRVTLGPGAPDVRLAVRGKLEMIHGFASVERLDIATPRSVMVRPAGGELILALTPTEAARFGVSPQLTVSALSFQQVDQASDDNTVVVRQISTITAGIVYYSELNEERTIRPSEVLRFEDIRGEIRSLRIDGDRIDLSFHGTVRGMRQGTQGNDISIMPTWVEWLRARHALGLYWASTFYVFGLVWGLLKWTEKGS